LAGRCSKGGRPGLAYDVSSFAAVAFNTGIANLETADVILLVGSDLRHEAPLINTRVQKAIRKRQAQGLRHRPRNGPDLQGRMAWHLAQAAWQATEACRGHAQGR
jgi:predicted molibdopterin-dependent oxidoreductase YjgC